MQIELDTVQAGYSAVVEKLCLPETLQRQLTSFGMVPGTALQIRYKSPDSSVTALEFRGTVLAMRTRDLKGIRVKCG